MAEFKSKFDKGENVFFMYDNKIVTGKICGIIMRVGQFFIVDGKAETFMDAFFTYCFENFRGLEVKQDFLFTNRDDLIKSLLGNVT